MAEFEMKIPILVLCVFMIFVSGCVDDYHAGPDDHYETLIVDRIIDNQPSLYDKLFPNDQMLFSCYIVDNNNITYKVHYKSDCEKVKIGKRYGTEHSYANDYIILIVEE